VWSGAPQPTPREAKSVSCANRMRKEARRRARPLASCCTFCLSVEAGQANGPRDPACSMSILGNGRGSVSSQDAPEMMQGCSQIDLRTGQRVRPTRSGCHCQRWVKRDRVGSKVVPFGGFRIPTHLEATIELGGVPTSGHSRRRSGESP